MFEPYIKKLKLRRLSAKTIELYSLELKTFSKLKDKDAIEMHLASCAPVTHARKLIIWKAYLRTIGDSSLDTFEEPKITRKRISFLTDAEIAQLETYASDNLDLEDRLFIELGLSLGLRLSEILQVRSSRLDGEYLLITRKGGNEESVGPLPLLLQTKISEFSGFTRSKRHFQQLMHRARKACGFQKKITPHTLRHTFATRALIENNDIATIKEALGHSSLQSTERYLHTAKDRLKRIYQRGTL